MISISRCAPRIVAGLSMLCVAACGGSGGGRDGTVPPTDDTTPPLVTSVVAVDATHVDVVFDETLDPATAGHASNYTLVERPAPGAGAGPGDPACATRAAVAPGDTVPVLGAALDPDARTVHLTCATPLAPVPYDLTVTGVADAYGNRISVPATTSLTGTTSPDRNAPRVVDRVPAPGATGVGVGRAVVVTFSEPMDAASLVGAFRLEGPGGRAAVTFDAPGATRYAFAPAQPLSPGATYTVRIDSSAHDLAGNALAAVTWSFTTTSAVDTTPPVLVATTPADGAVGVPTDVVLAMTFDEPVDGDRLGNVAVSPDPGEGVVWFRDGGRTVVFDPDVPLLDNTLYTLVVPPGTVRDLAGNLNAQAWSIVFTTGAALPAGTVSGTLSGDPARPAAADPSGAIVVLATNSIFSDDDLQIVATASVGSGGAWTATHVPDGTFHAYAFLETNGDGVLDPSLGDAIGVYGIDWNVDLVEDVVTVAGGASVTGVDFALFDPMALSGRLFYDGTAYAGRNLPAYVGVFDTTGFSMDSLPTPVAGWEGGYPWDVDWTVEEVASGLPAGTYYVGAYLDVDTLGVGYDPTTDPVGLYGVGGPVPVTIAEGSDAVGIDIHLADPPGGRAAGAGPGGRRAASGWRPALRFRTYRPPRLPARPR